MSCNQAVLNRLQQSGSASAGELGARETTKQELEEELTQHKSTATKSREYYKSTTDKCKQQWKKIVQLTNQSVLSRSEELVSTKHCFTATISADFQQLKLVPSWGRTEQPESTYLQKVSHNLFGIVNHSTDESLMYIFDECIGPKNTDHTLSFLTLFWQRLHQQHPWIQCRSFLIMPPVQTRISSCSQGPWRW